MPKSHHHELKRRISIDGDLDWSGLTDEETEALTRIMGEALTAAWDLRDRLLDEYLAEREEKPCSRCNGSGVVPSTGESHPAPCPVPGCPGRPSDG